MDPMTCYREMLACDVDADCDRAYELADSLIVWFDGGGFTPNGIRRADALHLARNVRHRALEVSRASCRNAIARARAAVAIGRPLPMGAGD